MPRRLTIASQKGGTGKTTVALNLAVALAERGRRVLLADLDPQGGIGLSLAREDDELAGLADLMTGTVTPEEAILKTRLPGLSLLPRGRLDPAEVCDYEQALFGPSILSGTLNRLEKDHDLVLLDTPSGVGLVTRAALAVSDFVLVPFQTESLSLRSVSQILRVIEHVKTNENPRLQLLGILPAMVEKSKPAALSVLGEIWGFGGVLESVIPRADIYADASRKGLPVSFLSGAVTPESRRFELLAAELELQMQRLLPQEAKVEERPERHLL